MEKRYEIILEKFKAAENLRQHKRSWRESEIDEKLKERIKEMKIAEKVNELEMEAKIAWKFRESRKMINAQKRVLEGKIQAEMLKLKIKQDLLKQQKKFVRVERPKQPKGPKVDPLPYLRKRNKSFVDSEFESEDEVIEGVVGRGGVEYKISQIFGNTPSPSKKIWIKSGHRHVSPDVIRIKF
jgi:hypothetical protein